MYLRLRDYQLQIQTAQLNELTGTNDNLRVSLELSSMAEVISYLVQKYDTTDVFRDTVLFDDNATYKAKQLVELNAPAYDVTKTYTLASLVTVLQAGVVYLITADTASPAGAFDVTKWKAIGNQYDLWYIPVLYPTFNIKSTWLKGTIVFWKDNLYVCQIQSLTFDHGSALQFGQYDNIPQNNILPDDPQLGVQYWGTPTPYSFKSLAPGAKPADFTAWSSLTAYTVGSRVSYNGSIYQAIAAQTGNIPGADITNWIPITWLAGDNRNQQLIILMMSITLYHLHMRIAPKNIPQIRMDNYHIAKDWLKDAANGKITADLPVLQPWTGRKIRSGGNVKNINGY